MCNLMFRTNFVEDFPQKTGNEEQCIYPSIANVDFHPKIQILHFRDLHLKSQRESLKTLGCRVHYSIIRESLFPSFKSSVGVRKTWTTRVSRKRENHIF